MGSRHERDEVNPGPTAEAAQSPVLDWLVEALGSAGAPVKRIDTQGAVVLLAGDDAYKLRRAIRLPFLDYSTLEKRRVASEAEIALNREAAPDIYLGRRRRSSAAATATHSAATARSWNGRPICAASTRAGRSTISPSAARSRLS